MFSGDADVEQIILGALDACSEFVGEYVGLGGDGGDDGGVFGEFAEPVDSAKGGFAEVGDLVAVVDDYEAPGLDVLGGGGEAGKIVKIIIPAQQNSLLAFIFPTFF